MKALCLIPLALLLAGGGGTPHTQTLSVEQATALARKLANEQAQAQFKCQSFRDGPSAQFVQGHWVWQDLKAQGQLDVQGSVSFKADGADPNVNVTLLDNRATLR